MAKFFEYSRRKQVIKKDKDGKSIPILEKTDKVDEQGNEIKEPIPGKFEMEEKIFKDKLNVEKIIRCHELDNGNVIVLLDDGHEVTEKVPIGLKNPKKGMVAGNFIEEKQRQWVQSEILIEKDEVKAFYALLDSI